MFNWDNYLKNYIIRYSDKIRAVTRPLHEHLGVGYFSYHKIDLSGRCLPIIDLPQWAEIFVAEKIYAFDPLISDYRNYDTGCYHLNYFGSKEYIKKIDSFGSTFFNVHQNLILLKKTDTEVEFFDFYSKTGSVRFQNIYLNKLSLFKKFSIYFKSELASLLQVIEKGAPLISDIKKQKNMAITNDFSGHDFVTSIGLEKYVKISKLLTSIEKKCLKLLLEGYSAKETAVVLNLSPRTVEAYFETIKCKCNCFRKNQVFTCAKVLQELYLL